MPGKVAKIGSFSEWVGIFNEWRKEVGVNKDDVEAFHFDTLYGAIETEEIQFGAYKGPVSYTHLDVYKRQLLPRTSGTRRSRISVSTSIFSTRTKFVSATVGLPSTVSLREEL